MAKGNNTRKMTGGGWLTVLAILLVVVIVCGIITHGFKDWTACGCFGHKYVDGVCDRCGKEKPAEEHEQTNGNAIITNGESRGIMLASARLMNSSYEEYGVSSQAESAYTITATVDTDDEDFSRLNWEMQFVNASSEWANGKAVTDYVTMAVAADTHSATLECLQEFGEQIKVVVTAVYNSSATANCTVDYVKRIVNFDYSLSTLVMTSSSSKNTIVFEPTYGTGTITPTLNDLTFTSLELVDAGNPMRGVIRDYAQQIGYTCTVNQYMTLNYSRYNLNRPNEIDFKITPDTFFESSDKTSSNYKLVYNKVIDVVTITGSAHQGGSSFGFRIGFDLSYDGRLIQSDKLNTTKKITTVIGTSLNKYQLANNVTLSDTSIIL